MLSRKLGLFTVGAFGIALLVMAGTAHAQSTSGAIQGVITDEAAGGTALPGVTVIATSPALQGEATEASDDAGSYYISNLPPGTYLLTFVYGEITVRRENVIVYLGKVTPVNAKINTAKVGGEVITITTKTPTIDAGSTKQGTTIGQDYTKNVPLRGRTYEGALGATPGSQGDLYGFSFSGSTSVENNYVVDGINTTGLTYGTVGSPLLNNFIQEIEVITGGYNAEFGRATGGVVNVVTKTGSNEFHGSVWANVTPFEGDRDRIFRAGSALSAQSRLGTELDFGFELGGPIIKDKVWFYVGFAPIVNRTKVTRVAGTRVDRQYNSFDYAHNDANNDGVIDDSERHNGADADATTTTNVGCEQTQTCEADTIPDLDPDTGFEKFEEVDRREFTDSTTQYQFTSKINFAVSPSHQGQFSLTGSPTTADTIFSVSGTPTATQENISGTTTDAAFKWTSKLNNNKTQVDAILGWHHSTTDGSSINDELPQTAGMFTHDIPRVEVLFNDLGRIGRNPDENESDRTLLFCTDNDPTVADPFPTIQNCPVASYRYNSLGFIDDTTEDRYTGKIVATHRLQAAGHHQIKVGLDFEDNFLDNLRELTGGQLVQYRTTGTSNQWRFTNYVKLSQQVDSMGNLVNTGRDVCRQDTDGDGLGDTPIPCDYFRPLDAGEDPGAAADGSYGAWVGQGNMTKGNTFNWASFVQDSWSIFPNLTVNAGLRYEQQRLRYAEGVRDTLDPITKETIGKDAISLNDLFSPRLGVIYDWTKEGKSKVYAHWGRFYESIPMDLNDRSFGGEVQYQQRWRNADCGAAPTPGPTTPRLPTDWENCPNGASLDNSVHPRQDFMIGAGSPAVGVPAGVTLVTPGLEPQYMDEFVLGVEYEVLEDLRVGLSYQNRRLGRVIEDVSTDGASTYIIANPGEFSSGDEADLQGQIDAATMAGDMTTADALQARLDMYKGIRRFDKPVRDYNAVQLTASKRFSRAFMVQGSYTYSKTTGNYPGLFSPDTGQLDPNITSQYDLIELLANRQGDLPHDIPHSFKLDGYYQFDLKEAGNLTVGARLRAQSGQPINTLGDHALYGRQESYILPRGLDGRTSFLTSADLHLAYGRKLNKNMTLEVYFELFNVFNSQTETSVDQEYTIDPVAPIVGGTTEDLPYLKIDPSGGTVGSAGLLASKNKNYKNTDGRLAPLTGRIGATLTF